MNAAPLPAPDHPNEEGKALCGPTEGHRQTKVPGGQEERVDLGGQAETCPQESLRETRVWKDIKLSYNT